MNPSIPNPSIYGEVNLNFIYAYFGLAFLVALYLIYRHRPLYKIELFILSFYLMTGNINEELTFALPGLSFFEIQPDRFLFLVFSFFLVRRLLFSRGPIRELMNEQLPWFKVMLYIYILLIIVSQISHIYAIGIEEVILSTAYALNIVVLLFSLQLLASKETLAVIGKALIIGAVVTSIVSFIQFGLDPMFMRLGDQRIAFGTVLRSNGLFNNEYCNAYYLITALAWVMVSVKRPLVKYFFFALFAAGVFTTFQRMSWLILSLLSVIYLLKIEKIALDRLVLMTLSGLAVILMVLLVYHRDIMNSDLVKERLSERPESRLGYYMMVIDNIGKKPFFGYGGKDNELYYYSMLMITDSRKRATGEEGDIHSGYFSAMFYYGVPAFIFFTAFVLLALLYFGQLYRYHPFFAVPFLLGLLYVIGNLTNTLLFQQYMSIIYAIHLGLGLGFRYLMTSSEEELSISL